MYLEFLNHVDCNYSQDHNKQEQHRLPLISAYSLNFILISDNFCDSGADGFRECSVFVLNFILFFLLM